MGTGHRSIDTVLSRPGRSRRVPGAWQGLGMVWCRSMLRLAALWLCAWA